MNEALENINPIKGELRTIIEEMLAYEPYQDLYMAFARNMGYPGNDLLEAKKLLFTIQDGEIGFNVKGMEDLFLEFQLIKKVSNTEPYRSLLSSYPEAVPRLRELAKKILAKEPVTDKDILEIFNPDNYGKEEESGDRTN